MGILEQAKSSYLGPYLNLSALIQREAIAAEDNLKFLQCLEEPCKLLAKAIPRDIPALMPRLLNTIRMIWNVSRFYNTPEKAMGLLRKVRGAAVGWDP